MKKPESVNDRAVCRDSGDFGCGILPALGGNFVKIMPGVEDVSVVDKIAPRSAEQVFDGSVPLALWKSDSKSIGIDRSVWLQ